MTDPIAEAFPQRPLRITAPFPRWRSWLLALLALVLFVGGAVAISVDVVPALLTDHEIAGRAVPLGKARVESGRCQVRAGFLHSCDVTLALSGPNPVRRKVSYLFVDVGSASRAVAPMGDPARPELMSTDLGLERWTNRVVTFLVMAALFLALTVATVATPFLAGRQRRLARAMSGRMLHPEPATLSITQGQWIVTPKGGGPKQAWGLGRKARPFVVDARSGTVLAVTAPGAPLFPLDEELRWLDLTDEERARLRAARDALAA